MAAMEHFLSTICTLEWHVAHDLGHSTAESCEELAERHPEHADLIRAWGERSEDMIRGAIDETVAIFSEVRSNGVRCYALSNMEPETFPLRLERFEFLRWFDGHVISGLEGVVKPDPKIFRLLIERFGLEPCRTLFIDDSPVNVDAAIDAGLQAVQFVSPSELQDELIRRGLALDD
jgi:2-haloacid dehalogenase